MCVYVHVCQEEKKCCMLVLDEAGKDCALRLQKKSVQSKMGPYPTGDGKLLAPGVTRQHIKWQVGN